MESKSGILFYPCCGSDCKWPIEAFGDLVSACWFAERSRPFSKRTIVESSRMGVPVEFFYEDARDTLHRAEHIKVFIFKCDHDVDGEGSSGIRWFDDPLRGELLEKLCDESFIVTDGSNCSFEPLRTYWNKKMRSDDSLPRSFCHGDLTFECSQHLKKVRGYGPVFLWKVHRKTLT